MLIWANTLPLAAIVSIWPYNFSLDTLNMKVPSTESGHCSNQFGIASTDWQQFSSVSESNLILQHLLDIPGIKPVTSSCELCHWAIGPSPKCMNHETEILSLW